MADPVSSTTVPPVSDPAEHMIPKSRLDQEIAKRQEAEGRLATLESESQNRLAAQLVEQGKFKELADQRATKLAELEPKARQVEQMELSLKGIFDAQVAEIPEDKRGLIPDELSTLQKLNWIAKNRALLVAKTAPKIGIGSLGGGNPPTEPTTLSPEEHAIAQSFGYTDEEYIKFRS
jgi:hypothetical protein